MIKSLIRKKRMYMQDASNVIIDILDGFIEFGIINCDYPIYLFIRLFGV